MLAEKSEYRRPNGFSSNLVPQRESSKKHISSLRQSRTRNEKKKTFACVRKCASDVDVGKKQKK